MDRLRKIERMLSLQAKIHRLAEWQLADLDRQQTALADSRNLLFETLNGEVPLHGLFVEAMARRLAALARETDRLARARDAQQRRLQEEALRLKRFERTSDHVHRQDAEAARKRNFAALLDTLTNTDDASFP